MASLSAITARRMQLQPQPAVTAGWEKEKNPILPIIEAAAMPKRSYRGRSLNNRPSPQLGGHSLLLLPLQVCPSLWHSEAPGNNNGLRHPRPKPQPSSVPQQKTGQSVPAPNVNRLPLDNMLRVVTVVQQSMTKSSMVLCQKKTK
jgi:hypothetical protein